MDDRILFQYVMSYKAYRRAMISVRVTIAVVAAGALAGLCAVSIPLGIVLALAALFVGAITVVASLHKECTYTVYETRLVIKRGGDDRRVTVELERATEVAYSRAFYEKDLGTGTITVTATDGRGRKKRYRIKHILDAAPCVEFLRKTVERNRLAEKNA